MRRRIRTGLLVTGVFAHVVIAAAGAGVLVNRHVFDGRSPVALAAPPSRSVSPTLASTCQVRFTPRSRWDNGFTADLTLTNIGARIDGWVLTYSSPGVKVLHGWNGNLTQLGDDVTIRSMATNAVLAPGASITIGVSATMAAGAPASTSPARGFSLNGVDCG
jgi:cellulase/cellobiase CelA1